MSVKQTWTYKRTLIQIEKELKELNIEIFFLIKQFYNLACYSD